MAKKAVWEPLGDAPVDTNTLIAELSHLPEFATWTFHDLDELARDFVRAAAFASMGHPVPRDDISGLRQVQQFFISDISKAMRTKGLPVATSHCYHDAVGNKCEALVFRVARIVAAFVKVRHPRGYRFPLSIPIDPYRLFKASLNVVYN